MGGALLLQVRCGEGPPFGQQQLHGCSHSRADLELGALILWG